MPAKTNLKKEEEKLEQVASLLDALAEDSSVPRNVRASIALAKEKLVDKTDLSTSISGAIYTLDEISNDINLPMHARTMVWNILSELESLKEHLRQ